MRHGLRFSRQAERRGLNSHPESLRQAALSMAAINRGIFLMVVQGIRREVVPSYVAHAVVRLPRQRSVPRCGPLAAGGSIIPGKIGRASPPAVRAPKDNGLGRPPGRDCAPPEQRIHDLAPGRFAGIRRYPLPRPRPVPSGPPGAPTPNAAPNATTAGIRARAACVSGNPPLLTRRSR